MSLSWSALGFRYLENTLPYDRGTDLKERMTQSSIIEIMENGKAVITKNYQMQKSYSKNFRLVNFTNDSLVDLTDCIERGVYSHRHSTRPVRFTNEIGKIYQ